MSVSLPRLSLTSDPRDRVQVQEHGVHRRRGGPVTSAILGKKPPTMVVWRSGPLSSAQGMFGALLCREALPALEPARVLVLDAGSLLITEHVQNLSRIGLAPPARLLKVEFNTDDPGPRERVCRGRTASRTPLPGLAYCLGGRSLYWGGWAPRQTSADLAGWPKTIRRLPSGILRVGTADQFHRRRSMPIGETEQGNRRGTAPTDYISGPLRRPWKRKLETIRSKVATVDAIEDAPAGGPGVASRLRSLQLPGQVSSAPVLVDAIREAAPVPTGAVVCSSFPARIVTRLRVTNGSVSGVEARVNGQPRFPRCRSGNLGDPRVRHDRSDPTRARVVPGHPPRAGTSWRTCAAIPWSGSSARHSIRHCEGNWRLQPCSCGVRLQRGAITSKSRGQPFRVRTRKPQRGG